MNYTQAQEFLEKHLTSAVGDEKKSNRDLVIAPLLNSQNFWNWWTMYSRSKGKNKRHFNNEAIDLGVYAIENNGEMKIFQLA